MKARARWLVPAILVALSAAATVLWTRVGPTEIEGVVYAGVDPVGTPTGPVAGAVVSSDQSSTTTVTDSQGRFTLHSRRIARDEFFVITVRTATAVVRRRSVGYPKSSMSIVIGTDR